MISTPLHSSPTVVPETAERSAPFGDVLVAIYEEASRYSTDPEVVARLATEVVVRMLRRAQRAGRDC